MSSSLNIGTTGLAASQKQLDVIGNNLANASTVGFKAADCYFASMLSQSLSGGGAESVGQGVSVANVATIFSQGTFESTGNVTDVAIDGNGFFIVKDREGNSLYTRAGSFHVENSGLLSDINKYSVQGRMYDKDGLLETQTLSTLNLKDAQSKPSPTTYMGIGATLDSQTVEGGTFDSSQVVYDSRGAKHNLSTKFTKMGDGISWSVQAAVSDQDATLKTPLSQSYSGLQFNTEGDIDQVYKSTCTFVSATSGSAADIKINNEGNLYKTASITVTKTDAGWQVDDGSGTSPNTIYPHAKAVVAADGTLCIDLDNVDSAGVPDITFASGSASASTSLKFDIAVAASAPADIDFTFPVMADGAKLGKAGGGKITWYLAPSTEHTTPAIKTFATTSRIASLENDGYAPGLLTGLSIGKDGIVEGMFSNGQRQNLARMILADFTNLQGLNKVGSYFIETAESGPHVNNNPGSGGLGQLQSNSLEMSNTDTAKEFIRMITAQRAYQSSAKIIAAADQMLQVLMNVKQ